MSNQIEQVIMCPICLETMTKPILQCQAGHSMCGGCMNQSAVRTCPQCRGPLSTTRNYQLEQLIENIPKNVGSHEAEWKQRKFFCEGKKFAKWNCEWSGNYKDLEKHFRDNHVSNMTDTMQIDMDVDLTRNHRDVKIVSYLNGRQYFWYKCMVDVAHQKVYWVFQYIGSKKQAKNYFYEFEINYEPIRQFKVVEVCHNDVVLAKDLFKYERCVVLSFPALRSYLNDQGLLPVTFRIKTAKKRDDTTSNGACVFTFILFRVFAHCIISYMSSEKISSDIAGVVPILLQRLCGHFNSFFL